MSQQIQIAGMFDVCKKNCNVSNEIYQNKDCGKITCGFQIISAHVD